MDMYLIAVNLRMSLRNTYQLTNLWKKQRSFLSLEFMIDDTGEMAWYFLHIV